MTTENNKPITVEDIRKLALPLGTHVVSGDGVLARRVAWTTVIYPEDTINSKTLHQDEIVLLAAVENDRKSKTADVDVIRWATDNDASAIILSTAPSPAAIDEFKDCRIPVLVLPEGSRIRLIEKAIISLLVNRKVHIERRGTQIYRQLTQIASRNEGLTEIINTVARLTNKSVVIQNKRLNVICSSVQPHMEADWGNIESLLRESDNIPVEYRDRHRITEAISSVQKQTLSIQNFTRLVSPVVTNNVGRGYLSIIGRDDDLDEIDMLVAEHGAAACGLEMAKQKAVSETEKRLRGTFLERLLIGDVSNQEAVRQGERFEHDMTIPHLAIVLSWYGDDTPSNRRLETIVNSVINKQRASALVWQREREQEILVFHAPDPATPIDDSLLLAQALGTEIQRQFPQKQFAIGLGQHAKEIGLWRVSYRDATQALGLAIRLQSDVPLYIGDLGVYQLILSLFDQEKLLAFTDQTLGVLTEYDARQNADLIKTLEAFFTCHGNLSQTSEMLIVHRNTLLYRINRINDIAEIDLNRPETRLALHLALTIRRLLALN